MKSLKIGIVIALVFASLAHAQGVERICSGDFTDMRVIGVTIGDCDLNSIPDKEFKSITDICGKPSGIDDTNEAQCRISAIVAPRKSIPPANHGYGAPAFVVQKVLKVERN